METVNSAGSLTERLSEALEKYSARVVAAGLVLTLLLIIPLVAMSPDEDASIDPGGEAFELQDDIDDRFESLIHGTGYIVEARGGDILTQASLWELYQNSQELLAADQRGELAPDDLPSQPYLYQAFDTDTNRSFVGINTIAHEVQLVLTDPRVDSSLETATDDDVKLAVHFLFSNPESSGTKDLLSVKASSERRVVRGIEIDYWTSPAFVFPVLADNEKLGGVSTRGGLGANDDLLDQEEFNRNVQRTLRGEESTYRLWGFAIDQNLEAEDEGTTTGLFVMFTVIAALVVVGISLRSYWAMALTGVGLGVLMIWLKGISNLVGLGGGLVIELIVPIAMISLGVDFAVHAIRRYQEEKSLGHLPQRALRLGFAGVLGALVLAMLSDGIAFLANVSSGIEAVIHFGIAAGIAAASSFVVLGLFVPLLLMRIDELLARRPAASPTIARVLPLAGGAGVAALAGVSVLLLVVGLTPFGLVLLAVAAVVFLVVPVLVMRWRAGPAEPQTATRDSGVATTDDDGRAGWVADVVAGLAHFRLVVLLTAAGVTAVAVFFALQLDPELDVKDFFDSGSDFVVSLDKLEEHVAERGGEPGIIYVAGDLTDPRALASISQFVDRLGDNQRVGRDAEGNPSIEDNLLDALERVTDTAYARGQVALATGVEITDADGDGIPDAREQIRATYDYIVENGVPLDENTLVYDAGQIREVLFHDPSGVADQVTILEVGIPGTRQQTNVKLAREALSSDLDVLRGNPSITRAGLTGSPFVREGQLEAATDTLQRSLPIAVVAAMVLLLVAMRSVRYAVVTIIPIGLVVAWLYALMYATGFSLNFVTATIGAISIGVGIDFSIHMTERFREELRRTGTRIDALRRAANSTGVALLASAGSSIVGFVILGFAPMPMFSSFGYLTALMISLALVASLAVLPSLLMLVTPQRGEQRSSYAQPVGAPSA